MRTTKHFLLFFLVIALVATSLCSCDSLLKKFSPSKGTTPAATTPVETPPAETTPEETSASTPEETSASTPEETSSSTPEETSASTPEETSASTPEETSASTPEETSSSTPEETSSSTPEETNPDTPTTTTTVSKTHTDIADIAGVTAGQNTGNIADKEIKLDDNITIICSKGTSTSNPCIYEESIRLYQNGATLTIKGTGMKTILITLATKSGGQGPIIVVGGTASELTDNVYTITVDNGESEVVITTAGTDKNNRLYVANIEVTYATGSNSEGGEIVPEETTPEESTPVEPEETTPSTPEVEEPAADSTLTIEQAIALGESKAHNTTTEGKYYVTGVVKEIKHDVYGNMYIQDENGNSIYVYGTYSADGSVRYDAMDVKPVAGDTVTLYAVVGNYNGPQIKNAWIVEHVGVTPEESTPEETSAIVPEESTPAPEESTPAPEESTPAPEETTNTPDAPVEPETPAKEVTISFEDKANRIDYSTNSQKWTMNGIIVTNNKGSSTSNVGDYAKPARFYKSSELTIAYPGMTKIVITCNTAAYATACQGALSGAGVDGKNVTITFTEATDSFTFTLSGGQVRVDSITVYTTEVVIPEETTPVEPEETTPAEPEVTTPEETTGTPETPDEPEISNTVTVSKTNTDIAGIAGVTAGQNTGVIADKEIKLDDNISIICSKGSSTSDPCIYTESIRLYQNGATLTIKGTGIKTILITLATKSGGQGPIAVTGGTASELTNNVYTITVDEGASEVVITTKGTDKNSRLYVAQIDVTYTTGSGTEN